MKNKNIRDIEKIKVENIYFLILKFKLALNICFLGSFSNKLLLLRFPIKIWN